MSARPALRAPAGAWTVARHYLGMLGSGGGRWGVVLAAVVGLTASPGEDRPASSAGEALLGLAFLLALLHWRGTGHAGGLDGALPLRRARHDAVRVACGAAWAVAALLVLAGLLALRGLLTGEPAGVAAWALRILSALPLWLTMYAVAAAVRLRARRPRLALLAAYVLLAPLAGAPPAFWVAAAVAVVWLSTSAALRPPHLPLDGGDQEPAAAPRTAGRPLAPRGWSGPRTFGILRRPTSLRAVFGREARLVARRMAWPLVFACAWACARIASHVDAAGAAGPSASGEGVNLVVFTLGLVTVWACREQGGAGREYDGSLPVGAATRRALRVGAGAMWLAAVLLTAVAAVAAVAGTATGGGNASLRDVPLHAWAGVPGAVLLVYLLASIPVLLSARNPFLTALMYTAVLQAAWRFTNDYFPAAAQFLPWSALAPLAGPPGPAASWAPALALWLPLSVLAVPAAAALGARLEHTRPGRSAQPSRATLAVAAGGAA